MSSDSEDDCYGNVAQKLQKMKNKYVDDKIETFNLLNDSSDLNDTVQNSNSTSQSDKEWPPMNLEDIAGPSVSTESDLSQEVAVGNTSKRRTRAAAKKAGVAPDPTAELPPARVNRRKRGTATPSSIESSPRRRGRGRGRGRGRNNTSIATPSPSRGRFRSRGRRNSHGPTLADFLQAMMPTYNIGDADEVPDHSEGQALFSSKKPTEEVVIVEENDPLDDNEELSVKVYWQSCEFFRFKIRRYQKLAQIFEYFSNKNNISHDKLLFTYNEKILKADDTPDSIDYNIVKFIDGGVVNQSVSQLVTKDSVKIKDGIKIKFQCQNVKKPFEIMVNPDDKFSLTMTKCAEHLELPLTKIKFEFDGDCISGKSTARELELEGGECIDVKIVS